MGDAVPYRVEYSTTSRAGCKANAICKRDQVKIMKSELRFGTYVTIDEHGSWQWRHWGCITPAVLKNVNDKTDGDYDLLDGLEDLREEDQEKVKRALRNGQIDDADITEQARENMNKKGAADQAKAAEKKAKQLQKEREKESQKAEKEKQKAEQKAQKEEEKKAKKAEQEASKAAKAKKRKRETYESETDSEGKYHSTSKRKGNIKQEDGDGDSAPQPKPKAKRAAKTGSSKKKAVKEEREDVEAEGQVKEEVHDDSTPQQVTKLTAAKPSDVDGSTDGKASKGRGKTKASKKTSAAPTRRSTRTKR